MKQKYWIVGNTHVDLAWKKDRQEMCEVFDIYIARVLDILDSHPEFTYTIEQAAHYRLLARRRPDLFARVKRYIKEGRLEMVGGMASTLETNLPNGECFIRNQSLGLKWTKEHLEVDVQTPWLIDTFGIHAQIPQLLRQFGFNRLMANRFGGNKSHDVFVAKGIDGSEVLIAGRDVYSPYVAPGNVYWELVQDWGELDQLFLKANTAEGDGPILITAYTENEILPSTRPDYHIARGNANGNDGLWRYSLLSSFFEALEAADLKWPVLHGDLNPEFTGTFSLRIEIRLRNRRVENLLLEAEKWAALVRLDGGKAELEEAWWEMAYIQFHDVFTGSHPTKVFLSLLKSLDEVEAVAQGILNRALCSQSKSFVEAEAVTSVMVFNGLPWKRNDLIVIPIEKLAAGVQKVRNEDKSVLHDVKNGHLRILAQTPSIGAARLTVESGIPEVTPSRVVGHARIENEYLILECDSSSLIKRLIWKETGKALIENAADLLTIQRDLGNFQIEKPSGAEILTVMGDIELVQFDATAIGHRIIVRGAFPSIPSIGVERIAVWEAEFELRVGKPALDVSFRIHWQGEMSRLRFNLSTTIESSEGIYEIPFGTVHRKPYGVRGTSNGEWPTHRFVAIEDQQHGVALINKGASGVEINGGRISTTLLRAPKTEYAGMVMDETSSQHGEHTFEFMIAPYCGSWSEAGVVQLAQEANSPLSSIIYANQIPELPAVQSFMTLSPGNVVLSSLKADDLGIGELIVRVYETAGHTCKANLWICGARRAWKTNVNEAEIDDALVCTDGNIELLIGPFEIYTIRVCRD